MSAHFWPYARHSGRRSERRGSRYLHTPGFESFLCTIDAACVEEEHPDEQGKVDYSSLKPVLFGFPTHSYLKTEDIPGKCLSFKDRKTV